MHSTPRRLLIHGWRGIPHSYSVVNQWTLLALRHRPEVATYHRDAPYFRETWEPISGLFSPDEEAYLAALSPEPAGLCAAEFRICYPFTFGNVVHQRTAVFGTSEYKAFPPGSFASEADFEAAREQAGVFVVTPSRWSAEGFLRRGFPEQRILVVPHGVDVQRFHPDPAQHVALKTHYGLSEFVFLNIGAMTPNKGMDLLLRAFAEVARRRPEAQLLLKGSDHLYPSDQMLNRILDTLMPEDRAALEGRFKYHGSPLSMDDMAALYQVADAYVSPYRAEGFNLPVLEAASCGLPVICTEGGPTDDFVTDAFAKRIQSRRIPFNLGEQSAERLEPDFDHLVAQMLAVMDDATWRRSASIAAVQHVHQTYTWDRVTDRLIQCLIGP